MLRRLINSLSDIAALAIAGMIFLTIADVLMKNVFHRPIAGVFEIVELLLVVAVFFGLPEVFRTGANICVDVVDHMVGPAARHILHLIGAGVSLGFLLLLGWAMIAPAWDTVAYPQNTQEAGIPVFAYWIPILTGTALTIIATAVVCWSLLRRSRLKENI